MPGGGAGNCRCMICDDATERCADGMMYAGPESSPSSTSFNNKCFDVALVSMVLHCARSADMSPNSLARRRCLVAPPGCKISSMESLTPSRCCFALSRRPARATTPANSFNVAAKGNGEFNRSSLRPTNASKVAANIGRTSKRNSERAAVFCGDPAPLDNHVKCSTALAILLMAASRMSLRGTTEDEGEEENASRRSVSVCKSFNNKSIEL